MLKRILALFIALVFLAQTSVARIQDKSQATGDWTIVELLKKGEKLSVELKSGKNVNGKLASVSQTGLSISEGGKTTDLNRNDVSRIYQLVGRTRGKSALRGAAIGGAIGLGSGLSIYLPARDDLVGWIAPAFGVIGAGIGAGVGAVFSGAQKRILIYQSN
ncbi:MAG: hypothetical protein L0220_02690 [Acidobacteria bacterium]|nr:hypothetical protein [Acidobacteriota bacterium]